MNLLNLLENVDVLNAGDWDVEIKHIAYDSRKVVPGTLFVAIKGYLTDGHRYISSAIEKGAVAVVVTELQENLAIPQIAVENSRKTLAILSGNYYGHPSREMTLVGITATNGKTSTSMMLEHIMVEAEIETGLLGTIVYKIKGKEIPSKLTTPESLELQGFFRELADKDVTHTVMEVSSAAQEMYRTYGSDFDIVCLNNISREHIDQHGSFKNYWLHKQKLITQAKEDAFAVLNMDDEHAKSLRDKTKATVITFGDSDKSGDVYIKDVDLASGFGEYTLVIARPFKTMVGTMEVGEYLIRLSVAGYHSIVNSVSAIIMALVQGISMEVIQKAMATFAGIERRFQLIYNEDYKIVDDHFANAGNIDVTLKTLSMMDYGKLHVVYGIRGNRGATVNGENIDTLCPWIPKLKLGSLTATSSEGFVDSYNQVSEEELQIFKTKMAEYDIPYDYKEDLDSAIRQEIERADPGDLVLLAGCQGMDYGAKLALEHIHRLDPSKDEKALYRVLEDRVAGV